MSDIWKDPMVRERLKEGKRAEDIAVISCPDCHTWGYYNEGSHFSCQRCDKDWDVISEDEEAPDDGRPYLRLDGWTTLADTVEVED